MFAGLNLATPPTSDEPTETFGGFDIAAPSTDASAGPPKDTSDSSFVFMSTTLPDASDDAPMSKLPAASSAACEPASPASASASAFSFLNAGAAAGGASATVHDVQDTVVTAHRVKPEASLAAVSYTHLTLPTICSV